MKVATGYRFDKDGRAVLTTDDDQRSEVADPFEGVPLSVGFAIRYLDGVMEHEHQEIQQMWRIVRDHLLASPRTQPPITSHSQTQSQE